MNWVHNIIQQLCKKLGVNPESQGFDGFRIGSYRVRVVNDDPTFTIKVFDFDCITPPQEISNIYWDELETSLEDAVKSIK